jgi:ATP-binding cassette, subfamily B, multidrug efflux pump
VRRPGGIEALAQLEVERAARRSAVARRLIGELAPYKSSLLVAAGFIAIMAFAQAAGPYLVGRAIDVDIGHGDALGLLERMAALLAVYGAGALARRAQTKRVGVVGQRVLATLRTKLFDHLQRLPMTYFDRRPIGDLMSRLLSDIDTLSQFLTQGLTQLVGPLFGLLGILASMLRLNLRLALACFTIIPVMLFTTWFFAARARKAYRKARQTVGDVNADLQEEIGGVREAQAFNRTERNIERFRGRNAANRNANVTAVGITSAFSPAMDLLSTLSMALVIGYGGYLVSNGSLTVGLLASFLIYVQQFFQPVQMAASVYTQMQSALAGAERIFSILDEAPEPADPPGVTDLPQPAEAEGRSIRSGGRIDFDDVSFAYELSRPVLHGVSFTVEPGQTVALVGRTGAGKTTVASLIPRFYDATGGSIRIDGLDVRQVTRRSLRRHMAMVPQEPFLFSGSVADNIAYGRAEASRSEIEAAARAVNAHDFITALPKGYDTVLGESGLSLSQGQRQLLAFARAIAADPRILILDEATANIDSRTEELIQRALGKLLAGRTSVVIAHRLSTIRSSDLILVVDAGRIVERGRHEELLALGGLYAELYRRQFREPPSQRVA